MNDLYLLAINLTQRCNLACDHCYLDATTRKAACVDELSCEEVCDLLDTIASRSEETMVVLTGGEPLLRPDLETMVHHGANLGLTMVVGSNGTLLTENRVKSLSTAGLLGIGISVDSLKSTVHDEFRGVSGCWQKTMDGIEICRQQGLSFQIHFTVTNDNADELPEVIQFCREKGARVLNVFFLICTGRGETLSNISPRHYERVVNQIIVAQQSNPDLIIRVRCAPQYKRIAYQMNPQARVNRISGSEGDGCIAASHYCRIGPRGQVTPCPYIEEAVGSIREQAFWQIWDESPTFRLLREPQLKGKCGECEFRQLCGGCRARPLTQGNTILDEDPWCDYQPQSDKVIEPWVEEEDQLTWHPEAERRINRIPGFIRKIVKKKAEAYVLERGESIITCDHLSEMTAKRFGSRKPWRMGQ